MEFICKHWIFVNNAFCACFSQGALLSTQLGIQFGRFVLIIVLFYILIVDSKKTPFKKHVVQPAFLIEITLNLNIIYVVVFRPISK